MLRLDVLFAQRKISENHCITREERVTKMNSYSSKRKREVEQSLIPTAASGVYQGLGMSVLATPTTIGDFLEVEPPRKRIQTGTDTTVLQNTLVTRSVDRGVPGGVNRLLSNEQIQQFINSTVVPQNRTITNAAAPSSVRNWSQYIQDGKPTQQSFTANESRQFAPISATNYVQAQSQQSQQYMQPVVIPSGQSQYHMIPATVAMGYSFPQNNRVAHPSNIPTNCNLQSGVQQFVQILSEDGTCAQLVPVVQVVPQSGNAPKPKKARRKSKKVQQQGLPNGRGQATAELTNQYHLTSHVSPQYPHTNQLDQFRSRYLIPQALPTYVKPAEARTRHETKSPKQTSTNVFQEQAEIPRNICQQVDYQQREATVNKSKAQSSTEKAGGKKSTERAVVPPKTKKDHVDYPPYVHRIMRILNRAEQRSQAEKSSKENDNEKSQPITNEFGQTMPVKCSYPKPVPVPLDNINTVGSHSRGIFTECEERSSEKYPQPRALDRYTASQVYATKHLSKITEQVERHTVATEGIDKVTRHRTEPTSGSQTIPTPHQKSSPVRTSACKQLTADKRSWSIGNDVKLNQTGNNKEKTESKVKKDFPVETHVSKVDVGQVLEDLFPESSDVTLLEADSFYGPELMVTCGDYCFVAPFASWC